MDIVKAVGKYLDAPIGTVCYNTDRVLTTVLDKENIEGFASIILHLAIRSGIKMPLEQSLLCYQWLEHIAMYTNQATTNPAFAKNFLQGINRSLEKSTYLTGNHLTVADIAAYHVFYTLIERLSVVERESLIHVCRWLKHVQSQPKVYLKYCEGSMRYFTHLAALRAKEGSITLNINWLTEIIRFLLRSVKCRDGVSGLEECKMKTIDLVAGRLQKHLMHFPLPKQVLPHELKNVSLDEPVVYHPQPFSFPGYPIILYL